METIGRIWDVRALSLGFKVQGFRFKGLEFVIWGLGFSV